MNLPLTFGFSNQLRQYIDAGVQQIAHDMSVVTAHVILLRHWAVEETPGSEIELRDLDVVR